MEGGESEYRYTYYTSSGGDEQSVKYKFNNARAQCPSPSRSTMFQGSDVENEEVEEFPRISTPLSLIMGSESEDGEPEYHGMDHPYYSVPPPTPILSPESMNSEPEYDPIDYPTYARPYLSLAQTREPGPRPPSADVTVSPEVRKPDICASNYGRWLSDRFRTFLSLRERLVVDNELEFDELYSKSTKHGDPEGCDEITSEDSEFMLAIARGSVGVNNAFRDHWKLFADWRELIVRRRAEKDARRPTNPVAMTLESEDMSEFI